MYNLVKLVTNHKWHAVNCSKVTLTNQQSQVPVRFAVHKFVLVDIVNGNYMYDYFSFYLCVFN